jgi:hypothetical protein
MMARTGIMRALNGPRGKRGRNDIHFWKICGLGVKSQILARNPKTWRMTTMQSCFTDSFVL